MKQQWVEKYRPKKLEDVIIPDSMRTAFKEYTAAKLLPHLMFVGGPGTGKTTVARILMEECEAESLTINASDERGIDVVRTKIKTFLSTEVLFGKNMKVVFLDEADSTTFEFQTALRAILEDTALTGRIIFSLNYPGKVIAPLISRTQAFNFPGVSLKETVSQIERIAGLEKVTYDLDDVVTLVRDCDGDMRKAINAFEKGTKKGKFEYTDVLGGKVDGKNIEDLIRAKSWDKLEKIAFETNMFSTLYSELFDTYWKKQDMQKVNIVHDFMFKDSIMYDKQRNFLAFTKALAQYIY